MRSIRMAAVALALVASACSDDDEEADVSATTAPAAETTAAATTVAAATPSTPPVDVAEAVVPTVDDSHAVGGSRLYSVDLATGSATALGPIGGAEVGVLGLTLDPGGASVYALTDVPELITFDVADPATLLTTVPVMGVAAGSTLLALDADPAGGRLLALSDAGVLYAIDPATGAATVIGGGLGAPIADPGFGFDVDPTAGVVRVDVATGEQLLVDPATGALARTAAPVTFRPDDVNAAATPRVVALAHGEDGVFGVDVATGSLVWQDPPDDGQLTTVGPLGIDLTDGASLDIARATGQALLAVPG
jgi:hypothetical protein